MRKNHALIGNWSGNVSPTSSVPSPVGSSSDLACRCLPEREEVDGQRLERTHPMEALGVCRDVDCYENYSILSVSCRACLILSASVPGLGTPGGAHDWYREECCRAKDCAPVESWALAHTIQGKSLPQLSVTTKHGTAMVPRDLPRHESKDNRMHACMRGWGSVKQVVCIFFPPGT
jgi:hypothetical protein